MPSTTLRHIIGQGLRYCPCIYATEDPAQIAQYAQVRCPMHKFSNDHDFRVLEDL